MKFGIGPNQQKIGLQPPFYLKFLTLKQIKIPGFKKKDLSGFSKFFVFDDVIKELEFEPNIDFFNSWLYKQIPKFVSFIPNPESIV